MTLLKARPAFFPGSRSVIPDIKSDAGITRTLSAQFFAFPRVELSPVDVVDSSYLERE